ncbi:PIR protein [Plasmodium yoelii]|uniref:PIR protein n=2 Tax=Plasmodium yoelii TaxID=5861 RepID=A0AAF0B371_PLAYO|nr:PIR protein [Plasmodium yoelii]WBY56476.1 PIR protein [Plasmodium yoelii yoelii]CDU17345.1 YIR protein [Plasmodium yoelii]VTZ76626.1 PIR protein [Plasmodium yoelii]|eukprot:XP_022811858.1 PIR protein [Plasmodium yoelii]
MLTSRVCGEFESMWKFFSDDLSESGNYNFATGMLKSYCPKGKCDSYINKIDAGCLWLFNKLYGDNEKFMYDADGKTDIVVYIMIWLGYKLNKKLNTEFPNLNEFYNKHMKNTDEYNNHIDGVDSYSSYNDLINKKEELVNISNENMSKLYDLFKILCNMINNAGKKDNGETYLKHANEFVGEYQKLFNDNDNNVEGNSYNKILSILSNDYTSYGEQSIYSHIKKLHPKLITEKKTHVSEPGSNETQMDGLMSGTSTAISETKVSDSETDVLDSETTLSSSLTINKLISIPFVLVVTLILLGIAYKYSLFGFRKRSQKHLREKLKT